ncbi:MAG: hypothetical protein V1900_00035 [Candidatus Aenigmatarchaeota archaeon]
MNPFELLVSNLNQMGFFGFLLPWLLTFAVSYGLLVKSKVLGEDVKIVGVVSLVLSFFVIGYGGLALGLFFQKLFGVAVVVIGGILVIVLFVGMAGGDISKLVESKAVLALIAGIGIIVFVLTVGNLGIGVNNEIISAIFVVIIMAVAIMFITGGK